MPSGLCVWRSRAALPMEGLGPRRWLRPWKVVASLVLSLSTRVHWQSSLQFGSGSFPPLDAYHESLGSSGENSDLGGTQDLSTPTEEVPSEALSLCHSFYGLRPTLPPCSPQLFAPLLSLLPEY